MTSRIVWTGDLAILRPLPRGFESTPLGCLLRESALTVVNLEVPLTTATVPADKVSTLRAHPDRAADLTALGVNVTSLANNHALDYGVAGLWETRAALLKRGIAVIGAGDDLEAALRPYLGEIGPWRVAIFAIAATLPPGFAASPDRPGVAPVRVLHHLSVDPALVAEQPGIAPFVHTTVVEEDLERITAGIAAWRAEVDLIAVVVHWGVPHGWTPASQGILAEYQPVLGRRLIDAGADLVVGHHAHAVHPAEGYRDGLIAYSLGNFLFHGWPGLDQPDSAPAPGDRVTLQGLAAPYHVPFDDSLTHESTVLVAELPATKPRRGPAAIRYRWIPTVMDGEGNPRPAEPERAWAILGRLGAGGQAGVGSLALRPVEDSLLQTVVGEVVQ